MSDETQRGQWTSASSAPYDALCSARHLRQRGLAEAPQSEEASSGSRVHASLAGKDVKLTLEERDVAEACAEIEIYAVRELFGRELTVKDLRRLMKGPVASASGLALFVEHRFWVSFDKVGKYMLEELRHSGQVDLAVVLGKKAFISDRKSLWGEHAEADRNLQLRDLAVLLWANVPGIEEVCVLLVQPRVNRHPTPCVYNLNDLAQAWSELRDRVKASNDPNSRAIAGEKQCKFCRAALAGTCPEYKAWLGAAMPAITPGLPICTAAEWTPEQRALFCERDSILENWLKDRRRECKSLLQNDPSAIPGYALKEGAERTTITNPQEVFSRFLRLGGEQVNFMPTVTVWPGKLRDALADVSGLKGKELAKAFDAMTDGCAETKRNEPSIVRSKP